MKRSLKSNRVEAINLGTAENYTHDNMVNRWNTEKNKWLERRQVKTGPDAEEDVCGPVTMGELPEDETDAVHMVVRRTMKQLSGPYQPFPQYYPLEHTIELYFEIWNESSSDE